MVQTDLSQLSAECQEWRQILRNYREELQLSKKSLQEICRKNLSKDQLKSELNHQVVIYLKKLTRNTKKF